MTQHVTGPLVQKDTCRACREPLAFAITAKGRRMPLDIQPVDLRETAGSGLEGERPLRGLQVVESEERALATRQATLEDLQAGRALYRSHFATCPAASAFRRGR